MPGLFTRRPHRRSSLRWRQWDYRAPGAYFITICTHQRLHLFDDPRFRAVAENNWLAIPTRAHARHVKLDNWVLMPNHLHGIVVLTHRRDTSTGAERDQATTTDGPQATQPPPPVPPPDRVPHPHLQPGSVGAIVGQYKSVVTRWINVARRSPGAKVWQRGYYDRVIRDEAELERVRRYIEENPQRWAEDRDNLDALLAKMDEN